MGNFFNIGNYGDQSGGLSLALTTSAFGRGPAEFDAVSKAAKRGGWWEKQKGRVGMPKGGINRFLDPFGINERIFGAPKSPPKPANPPVRGSAGVQKSAREQRLRAQRGRRTVFTSPRGLTDDAPVARKELLGG